MQEGATPAARLVARPGLLVIAHRGASKDAPENTLPAFRAALETQADLVELDTHETSDGIPVVFHDAHLDRTTDARARWGGSEIPIVSRSLEDLQRLDAGSWFDARFAGTQVPTLAAALDVIQSASVTLIERKAGRPETMLALLEARQLVDRVIVQSFDWAFLAACRQQSGSLVLGALGSKVLSPQRLADVLASGARVLGWKHQHITAELIAEAHAKGLKVWAWTVDDVVRARALEAMGVDGVITNVPARMIEALR